MSKFEIYSYYALSPANARLNLFFAHANGVPALTYKNFFEKLSLQLNINIFTYDMRGIGKTVAKENIKATDWAWQILIDDHISIFEQVKKLFNLKLGSDFSTIEWVLSGHSLGAWLSLLSAEKLSIKKLWLFDPPILRTNIILKWITAILIKKRHLSPNSQKVKKRKLKFNSYEHAYDQLKQSSFMKKWDQKVIYDYLEGSFAPKEDHIYLRHNPEWEAKLFEHYPPTAFLGFFKISYFFRKSCLPIFFVGEKSDTCNPKAKYWVKFFFPKLKWVLIPNAGHMYPFEQQEETIEKISVHMDSI